jgi:HD-GYP domain-containing protein (c-di-GMP phosphodiesterase class II)
LIGVKIAEGVNAAMPLQEVLAELERGKGKQFDPQIVEIFLGEKIF